jgi:hypothetical protein
VETGDRAQRAHRGRRALLEKNVSRWWTRDEGPSPKPMRDGFENFLPRYENVLFTLYESSYPGANPTSGVVG